MEIVSIPVRTGNQPVRRDAESPRIADGSDEIARSSPLAKARRQYDVLPQRPGIHAGMEGATSERNAIKPGVGTRLRTAIRFES